MFRSTLMPHASPSNAAASESGSATSDLKVLELNSQARKNLELVSKSVKPTDYWRVVTIPGMVQDRPGVSDRGVTSPAVGVVSKIHVFPGDTVRPGETLVTLQLFSEYLQATQTSLFKATQEISLTKAELDRVSGLANVGGVSGNRLIELRNEIKRQQTQVQASRQELLTRGLSPQQIAQIESGTFVSTIEIVAPQPRPLDSGNAADSVALLPSEGATGTELGGNSIAYEVQQLPVELGQTVQAGQVLANLSNHQSLYVVGHAFKREARFLEVAAQQGREIQVEFADDSPDNWSDQNQSFVIRHLSNSIDPESRTFDFFIPLSNQSRTYQNNGETFLVWRYRPGQRTRIHVPVEKLENVLVIPAEGVVTEGPESFVFRQNGDLFNQISVNVLYQDRRNVVIANDGSMTVGAYYAQNAAASLNRVLKAQSASGEQPGLHVHPDGTVHAAH
ncbi:efflux RND transporter periplasmic adaptor subunit [Stieleria sp. JC731]|uniref:efflux RND transporter periplasmic adaptor subunit n=1 Tax=Pirellulaceae TaxID=2691357 RepID=UPI001E61CE10|nr:efflux RND transporter periplasmic adaptor subunit [Stieleria sp. JC731]MCC9601354.1 efflux RND transporter periplasmic adaptor subunit [Stieleria sp. JC731]